MNAPTPAALDALAAELRSSAELPICPFDLRAPRHDLKPTDPCPICGGLGVFGVDGDNSEDRCRGADLSVLGRAADAITALRAIAIASDTARASAETALAEVQAEITRFRAVEAAARKLPRRTPAAGINSTVHQFPIEAGIVWENDMALLLLDEARAASPKPRSGE